MSSSFLNPTCTNIKIQNCPICKTIVSYSSRYPDAICEKCVNLALDSENCPVQFSNIDGSGGFISYHKVGELEVKRSDHKCWINGIECVASEARFGGIVVQPIIKFDK